MALLLRRSSRTLCPSRRAFSTSRPIHVNLQWEKNHPDALADAIPPYPYGPTRLYKQSKKGLYGGVRPQFGNNVSGPFEIKTRRRWNPNVKTKRLFSKSLNRYVQVRVITQVLRTIDKLGGLDEYLLGEKETRIKELGESGWWLRWAIMQTPSVKKRFAAEREALGLPAVSEDLAVEEEDLDASLEAATPDAEVAEISAATDADLDADAASETDHVDEVLAEDDAFEVEQDTSLPPLKFGVGPRQHIMLTEHGWRRTKPYDTRDEALKEKIRKDHGRFFMQVRMGELEKQLANATIDVQVVVPVERMPAPEEVLNMDKENVSEEALTSDPSAVKPVERESAPEGVQSIHDGQVSEDPLTTDPSAINPALEAEPEVEPEIHYTYETQTRVLNPEEAEQLRVTVMKQLKEELDAEVEVRFEQEIAKRQARRALTKERRQERRRAEREVNGNEAGAVA